MTQQTCQWLVVLTVGVAAAANAEENVALRNAIDSIRQADVKRHVDVLADDTFEGREAGSRGGRSAGVYLAKELTRAGVQPAGDAGTWYQSFGARYRNLLAEVRGSDAALAEEYLLVGAHYDHVGYGTARNSYGPTGYIHNGADDNASGTAVLLELAEALALLPQAPRRSILLAFWDGEEKGLLGSKHWVAHPTVPLDRIALAVNIDMIGRLRNGALEVGGTRTSWRLRRRVSEAVGQPDLRLTFPWTLKANSDHWPFYQRQIPVLMLHTGLHGDYHRPSDDAHKINHAGIESVGQLLLPLVVRLADEKALPGFRAQCQTEHPDDRQRLERPLAALPVRLGVWWEEPSQLNTGLPVTRLVPGSPAQQAGIHPGDRLLAVDGHPLVDGADLRTRVLVAPRSIQVTFQRAGEETPRQLEVSLAGEPVRVGLAWRDDEAEPGAVLITRVVPGSPADQAGLLVHDRIYQFDGQDFRDSQELLVRVNQAERALRLRIERAGQVSSVQVELPARTLATPEERDQAPATD